MRLLRKRKTLLITMVMCISLLLLFSQAAFAANGVKLSASDESGAVGDEVTVKVNIENAEGITGIEFSISFDSDLVKPKAIEEKEIEGEMITIYTEEGAFLTDTLSSLTLSNYIEEEGKLKVISTTPYGDTEAEGLFCTIVFEILAEGTTNLTFSDIVVSPDDMEAAAPVSGSIEGEDVDELQEAIDAANKAIADLPDVDDLTLDYKEDVEKARELVDAAKELGAEDDDFDELSKLEDAEKKIELLEAIKAADDAILALPALDELTLDDKPDVVAARALVNKAKDMGATDDDFTYLATLRAAENRIRELEEKVPTPPTGGMNYFLPLGMLVILGGLFLLIKRSRLASR